jgi:hypothetical protein
MIFPLSDTFARIAPLLPPALVHPEAIASINRIAGSLPEAISCACVECRLNDNPQVDFIACSMARDGGRAALAAYPSQSEPGGGPLSGDEWKRVFSFCAEWSNPESILYKKVPFIWLEFDINRPPPAVPNPFLIFCLQPGFMQGPLKENRPEGRVDPASVEEQRRLMRAGLAPLLKRPLDPRVEERLAVCARELPESGHIAHLAPHNTRGLDSYRLVLSISRDELPDYLRRIGWPGSMDALSNLLSSMFNLSSGLDVDLDISDTVLPTIGMSSYNPIGDPRWRRLLDTLVDQGVCSPAKREAALQWPGRSEVTLPGHKWPSELNRTLEVKVVYRKGEPLLAKVYLVFEYKLALFA